MKGVGYRSMREGWNGVKNRCKMEKKNNSWDGYKAKDDKMIRKKMAAMKDWLTYCHGYRGEKAILDATDGTLLTWVTMMG